MAAPIVIDIPASLATLLPSIETISAIIAAVVIWLPIWLAFKLFERWHARQPWRAHR